MVVILFHPGEMSLQAGGFVGLGLPDTRTGGVPPGITVEGSLGTASKWSKFPIKSSSVSHWGDVSAGG